MFGIMSRGEVTLDAWRRHGGDGEFNFWGYTPWGGGGDAFRARPGDLFYILQKGGARLAVGSGRLVRYEILDLAEAWRKYGIRNGRESFREFQLAVGEELQEACDILYDLGMRPKTFWETNDDFQRRSRETDLSEHADHDIGCVVLAEAEFFKQENWIDLSGDVPLPDPDLGGRTFPGTDIHDFRRIMGSVRYVPAWRRNDPEIERDAIGFWRELGLPGDEDRLKERASRLVTVAYADGQLIAACTANIGVPEGLKHAFAYFSLAVAIDYRTLHISAEIERASIKTISDWSTSNPEKQVGGVAAIYQAQHLKDWPISPNPPSGNHMHHYTESGDMVFLQWFDHVTV